MSTNLQDQAYEVLRDRIATGIYPPGTFLSENLLARDFDFSRTPLRAAIERLVTEGVLERRPRIGTFVRIIDPEELLEIYEIRLQLETLAAERAATCIEEKELACLDALIAEMEAVAEQVRGSGCDKLTDPQAIARMLAADMTLHQVLAWSSGNRWILKILDGLHVYSRFFGSYREVHSLSVVEQSILSHREIVDALHRRDPSEAAAALRDHLERGRDMSIPVRTFHSVVVDRGTFPLQIPAMFLSYVKDIPEVRNLIMPLNS